MSRDPMTERGGVNVYNFVRNAPSYVRDFLGLETEKDLTSRYCSECKTKDSAGSERKLDQCFVVFIEQEETVASYDDRHAEVGYLVGSEQSPTIGLLPGRVVNEIVENGRNAWPPGADMSRVQFVGHRYTCCCLSEKESKTLKDRYNAFQAEGNNPNPPWSGSPSATSPNRMPRTCAVAASAIISGLGEANIQSLANDDAADGRYRTGGSFDMFKTVTELRKRLEGAKVCMKEKVWGYKPGSPYNPR